MPFVSSVVHNTRRVSAWAEGKAGHSPTHLQQAALPENLASGETPVVPHGDKGSPLRAGTGQATTRSLGFGPSHSRRQVSKDDPPAESLFRTAQYYPTLPPEAFADLEDARSWARSFVHTYHHAYRCSAFGFVTPPEKHSGEDRAILCRSEKFYENARKHRPVRWFHGTTPNGTPGTFISPNPTGPGILEKIPKKSP